MTCWSYNDGPEMAHIVGVKLVRSWDGDLRDADEYLNTAVNETTMPTEGDEE